MLDVAQVTLIQSAINDSISSAVETLIDKTGIGHTSEAAQLLLNITLVHNQLSIKEVLYRIKDPHIHSAIGSIYTCLHPTLKNARQIVRHIVEYQFDTRYLQEAVRNCTLTYLNSISTNLTNNILPNDFEYSRNSKLQEIKLLLENTSTLDKDEKRAQQRPQTQTPTLPPIVTRARLASIRRVTPAPRNHTRDTLFPAPRNHTRDTLFPTPIALQEITRPVQPAIHYHFYCIGNQAEWLIAKLNRVYLTAEWRNNTSGVLNVSGRYLGQGHFQSIYGAFKVATLSSGTILNNPRVFEVARQPNALILICQSEFTLAISNATDLANAVSGYRPAIITSQIPNGATLLRRFILLPETITHEWAITTFDHLIQHVQRQITNRTATSLLS